MRSLLSISIDDADYIVAAGVKAAGGLHVSIAVVDACAALLAFRRTDGAGAHTIELASRKARTAAVVGAATADMGGATGVGAGGVPVLVGTQCAGAIGISGAEPEQDARIASAAAMLFASRVGCFEQD